MRITTCERGWTWRFKVWNRTENPGVGGSIPSLPTMFFSRLPTSKFSLNSVCAQICAQLRHTPAHSSARTRLRSGSPTFQSLPGEARGCWLRPGAWVGISLGSEFEVAPASPGFARRSDRTSVASALVRVCHRLFGGWCPSRQITSRRTGPRVGTRRRRALELPTLHAPQLLRATHDTEYSASCPLVWLSA